MITLVSLSIGFKKFEELRKAGVPFFSQDWLKTNGMRIAEMKNKGKEEVREGVGDTGVQVLTSHSEGDTAVRCSNLVEKVLNSKTGTVVYLKIRDRGTKKNYYLIVKDAEAGFEEPTSLSNAALALIKKVANKWFKNVIVWKNPDLTFTVNLFGDLNTEEFGEVQLARQVMFEDETPKLV